MKTKEIIKLLKEVDPTGETHVRVEGGIITFFEMKEGYWDGEYSYIDDDGNFIITTQGMKIDMHTTDYKDFILNNKGDYSKIKFDFNNYCNPRQITEKEDRYLEDFKKISENYKRQENQTIREFTFNILQRLKDGWKIIQDKNTKPTMITVKFIKGDKIDGIIGGEFKALTKSGLFKQTDYKENYYIYWEYDTDIKIN